jgi:copper chaperone
MTQAYRVTGMTCEGCVRAVTRAIKAQAPSADVSVDLARGTVTVPDVVDPKVVQSAVADAGFGFGGRA